MLRITPTAQQWAALEEVRLETQRKVAAESARHENIRTRQARMFKSKRRDGYISLENTLVETLHILIRTEPRALSYRNVTTNNQHVDSIHLTAKISETCPVLTQF